MDTRGSEPASNHYVHGYHGLPSSASESRGVPHNAHSLMHQPSAASAHPRFGYAPGSLRGQQHIGMSVDNQPEQLMEELQWRYTPHPPNVNNAHSITTPLCHNGDKNMLPNVYNEPGQGVNNLSSNDRFKNTTTYNTLNINATPDANTAGARHHPGQLAFPSNYHNPNLPILNGAQFVFENPASQSHQQRHQNHATETSKEPGPQAHATQVSQEDTTNIRDGMEEDPDRTLTDPDDDMEEEGEADNDPCTKHYALLLRQRRELQSAASSNSPSPLNPTAESGNSTWSQRNPGKPVQPSRSRAYRPKTQAERESAKLRSENMLEKAEGLENEIKSIRAFQEKIVQEMADKYKKSEKEIRTLIFSKPILKSKRGPNLKNALLHRRAKELNDGRAQGKRLSLAEIQESCNIGNELECLSAEQKEDLLKELQSHRELKRTRVRVSNTSAAQDLRQTMDRVTTKLQHVAQRVGCVSFLFTTRGNIQDHGVPGFTLTGNAADFIKDVLCMSEWELLRKFEQWVCAHDPLSSKPDTFQSMRVECTKLINEGLKQITIPDPITMNYINYDMQIVQRRRVKLIGWPNDVKFIPPSNITSVDQVRTLLHALRTKKCQWTQLSPGEATEHMEDIQQRKAAGEVVGRKCKERSDKGKRRKKRKECDEEGGKSSSEGRKAGGRRHRITSKAVVSGTDDDDDDDDGDED